ncbi:protein obstructor-E-like isoform X2 [Scylla paramamosain]|uniref:protein obstructor-E-like isoform X2 n=1 Tax=Scylla paramamosain TaxID=85552 RepID=UPI003082FB36
MSDEKLIELVRGYEELYDMNNKKYTGNYVEEKIWKSIGEEFKKSGSHAFLPGSPDSRYTSPRPAGDSFSLTIVCPPKGMYHYAKVSTCDQYLKCVEGKLSHHNCPEERLFKRQTDRKHLLCDYPENFNCPNGLSSLPWGKEKTLHPSPDSCREFYVCVGGVPKRQLCPFGKVFSEKTSACTQPQNVSGCEDFYSWRGDRTTTRQQMRQKQLGATQDSLVHISYDLIKNQHVILLKQTLSKGET